MSRLLTITAAEPVVWGVLKIRWSDGQEGIVDLRPVIAEGDAFAFLRHDPARFDRLRLADDGYSLGWVDDDGDDVDFAADSLRRRAEKQAETLRLAG